MARPDRIMPIRASPTRNDYPRKRRTRCLGSTVVATVYLLESIRKVVFTIVTCSILQHNDGDMLPNSYLANS